MSFTCKEPKLRFPGFSGEWVEKKLGELSEKISDGIHSTPEYDEDGIFHFINGNNLVNGKIIITDDTKKVSEKEYLKYKKPLGQNTILLSINGTIGNLSFFNDEKVVLGKSACFINIDEALVNKFFVNDVLKTDNIQNFFYSEVTGSTIKNLSLSTIKNTKLFIPSKPEQEKIASFLTAVDAKVEQLTCKEKLLEKYKKSAMQKLFSQELRFTCNDGSGFSEWRYVQLNKILSESKKRNFDKKFNKNDVLSVSGAHGIVNQIELQGRSFAGASVDNYHVVEIDDIVYTKSPLKSNPYGIIKANMFKAGIVSTLYAVYKPHANLNSRYLDYYFQKDINTNNYLRPLVHKGAKNDMKINNLHVLSGYISIPSLPEQTKIANFLSAIDEKLLHVKAQLAQTQQFKKALLQQMFV